MTTTIITTPQEDQRIAPAFGRYLRLNAPDGNGFRNATAAEVKADIVRYIRNVVHTEEKIAAEEAIVITDIDPQ